MKGGGKQPNYGVDLRQFLRRIPTRPLPQHLIDLVYEGITAFYRSPHTRSRSYWAFKGVEDYWTFSLLGMICMLNGLDLLEIPRNEYQLVCQGLLKELGFSSYDISAIGEINKLTYDIEILQARFDRYAETGERIAFPVDDLHKLDMERRNEERRRGSCI